MFNKTKKHTPQIDNPIIVFNNITTINQDSITHIINVISLLTFVPQKVCVI